jgi:hypothetical protein
MNEFLKEKEKKLFKEKRNLKLKEINKNQTKSIVNNFKENQKDISKEENFLKVVILK